MSNDIYRGPQGTGQPPQRNRRSDRHAGAGSRPNPYQPPQPAVQRPAYQPDDDHAPLPLGQTAPQPPQALPPRRERPNVYDYERNPVTEPYGQDGDYEEDDYPRLWPKLLALVLVVLLLISAVLYFLVPQGATGFIGTLRGGVASVVDGIGGLVGLKKAEPPKLIKFETPLNEVPTGVKVVFTYTADQPIDGVRMIDDLGTDLKGQLAAVDPERKVWTLSTVFDTPVDGVLRAEILRGETWFETDKTISLQAVAPTPAPTPEPAGTVEPFVAPAAGIEETPLVITEELLATLPTDTPAPEATPFVVTGTTVDPATVMQAAATQAPYAAPVTVITQAPVSVLEDPAALQALGEDLVVGEEVPVDEVPVDEGTQAAELLPEDAIAAQESVEEPAGEPAAAAQEPAAPTSTPMPMLAMAADESAEPKKLKITDTVYAKAKKVNELARDLPVNMPAPGSYVSYEGGVFTFRNDSFRGNAAFGEAEMPLNQLSVLWKAPLGSLRTGDGTLYGLGWTAQPAIVKWSVELRQMMNLAAEKKDVKALKEVIVGAQDGKIYFFDLNDGAATREPIDVGYPLKGSVSVDTQGRPLIGVGQGISKMPGKTGPIGYYLYELIQQKELFFLNGRKTKTQNQYSTNGAFDGTALFDRSSDTLVVAGENGLLYTVALGSTFDYLDKFELKVDPAITYLRTKGDQADMSVSTEASVAMYGKYAYTADRQGIIRAVDTDSMLTQWAFDAGDNTDATPALGFDEDGSLGLYTGTTVFTRTRKAGTAYIRRLDAMSGREVWKYEIAAKFDQTERAGVKASPVVGEHSISDLVIFTVNMTRDGAGATVVALNKQTGQEVWTYQLAAGTISSPVAVYRPDGTAYLIQADGRGILSLLDARTGQLLHSLDLEGDIDASPAVYNDVLVIGTTDKDNNFLYGIRLE